jgi:4-hydroxy-tetrahydrodipicolinate reductase
MDKIRITLAGATGWAGSALSRAIGTSEDLQLAAAVSRKHSGKNLGAILNLAGVDCPVFESASAALQVSSDVFFEYTKPDVAKSNVLEAIQAGRHVVIGTSGLTNDDYTEIDQAAIRANRGVLAVGNFALTVVLLQKFAELAARYIDHWEIVDYANDAKVDSPSGTAREIAKRLSSVRRPAMTVPLAEVKGVTETRGGTLDGSQVHSIRLPGYTIGAEVILGMNDQKLILKHEAGGSAEPYVAGALLALRKVGTLRGLHRGLDTIMAI